MPSMEGGTAAFITNSGVTEAIPVALVAGDVAITLGDVGLTNIAGDDINPATAEGQATTQAAIGSSNALLITIDGDTSTIAGDTTSLDAKQPALGTAAMAASSPVTIATDDTITLAANAILTTIDTDTGNIALGTGGTADALVDAGAVGSISAKLRRLTTDIAALETTLTNLEKCTMGNAAPTVDSYTSIAVNLAASTANQVLRAAPGANKQIWVYKCFMMADTAAGTVAFQDEDDAALSGVMAVSDEGGWVFNSDNFAMPWIKVATNKALEIDTGACTIDGIITVGIISV